MTSQHGSFVRWQATTIAQMGFVGNLVLMLAVAALGFGLTSAKEVCFTRQCWPRCFLVVGCLSMVASIGIGLWWAVNRLCDFRLTARIARLRSDGLNGVRPCLGTHERVPRSSENVHGDCSAGNSARSELASLC